MEALGSLGGPGESLGLIWEVLGGFWGFFKNHVFLQVKRSSGFENLQKSIVF